MTVATEQHVEASPRPAGHLLGTRALGDDHRPCGARQCRACAARCDWHYGAASALRRVAAALRRAGTLDADTAAAVSAEAAWHARQSDAYENNVSVGITRHPIATEIV